jgi:hypothetical protein
MSYPALQTLLDAGSPAGLQNYGKAEYIAELTDDVIDTIVRSAETIRSAYTQIIVARLGGAIQRVGDADTAVSHRASPYVVNVLPMWTGTAESPLHIDWADQLWGELTKWSTGGVYVNFLGSEGADRIVAAYGKEKYDVLVELKNKYDPFNLFHLNQNILPRPSCQAD